MNEQSIQLIEYDDSTQYVLETIDENDVVCMDSDTILINCSDDENQYTIKNQPMTNYVITDQPITTDDGDIIQLTDQSESIVYYTDGQLIKIENDDDNDDGDIKEKICDVTKITGKNLLTGQTLNLDTYMKKLMNRLETDGVRLEEKRKRSLITVDDNLINKRICADPIPIVSLDTLNATLDSLMSVDAICDKLSEHYLLIRYVEMNEINQKRTPMIICQGRPIKKDMHWHFECVENSTNTNAICVDICVINHKDDTRTFEVAVDDGATSDNNNKIEMTDRSTNLCRICGDFFENNKQLELHRTIKHGNNQLNGNLRKRLLSCSICGRTFTRNSNLQRHLAIHNANGVVFKCELCECTYGYASSLTRHVVETHLKKAFF